MIVTYTPVGQDAREWDFDPRDIPESVAEVIERRFSSDGETYEQWVSGIHTGRSRARRVLLWYLLWRECPKLRVEDVDPKRSELMVELSRVELEETISSIEGNRRLDPGVKDRTLAVFRNELDKLGERDGEGKAS